MASRKELAKYGSVKLPPTIPCNGCKIHKKQDQYSANRLIDLQKQIITSKAKNEAFNPSSESFVRCSLCVGGPAVEHECFHCEITFPRSDKYFSKSMLKNRKDEALCWTCSQREQNDTLSSDEDDAGNSSGSDDSDTTFVTNQFQDMEVGSTTSGSTFASRSNGFSSHDNSSGGVRLNGLSAPSTGGGTIYAGSASNMDSSRAPTTSPSVASGLNTQMSSRAGYSPSVAPSSAASSVRRFNPNAYSSPGRRSPTGSIASTSTAKSGSKFPKISNPRTPINMDAVHEQRKGMRREAPKKAMDLTVESDPESD